MCVCIYIYIYILYIYIYTHTHTQLLFDGFSQVIKTFLVLENTRVSEKVMTFSFRTGIITNTGIGIVHQKEAGSLWITSLLLNIVIERNGDCSTLE